MPSRPLTSRMAPIHEHPALSSNDGEDPFPSSFVAHSSIHMMMCGFDRYMKRRVIHYFLVWFKHPTVCPFGRVFHMVYLAVTGTPSYFGAWTAGLTPALKCTNEQTICFPGTRNTYGVVAFADVPISAGVAVAVRSRVEARPCLTLRKPTMLASAKGIGSLTRHPRSPNVVLPFGFRL